MKKVVFLLVCLVFISNLWAKSKIQITITNIKSTDGKIYVGLYKKNQNFPDPKAKDIIAKIVKPKVGFVNLTIDDLEDSEYAIAIMHDLNDNGKLDKNFLGIPTEPYGFSKNFKPILFAPTFNDCKFNLNNETKSFTIELID